MQPQETEQPLPYGYFFDDDGTLRIKSSQAAAVRHIFKCYRQGMPVDEIVAELHTFGVRERTDWTVDGVRAVLRNEESYRGGERLGSTETYPAILSSEGEDMFRKSKADTLPYGYFLEAGGVKVDTMKAALVRLIFRRRAEGKTIDEIAENLNRADPRLAGPGGRDMGWTAADVRKILNNEAKYRGGKHSKTENFPVVM